MNKQMQAVLTVGVGEQNKRISFAAMVCNITIMQSNGDNRNINRFLDNNQQVMGMSNKRTFFTQKIKPRKSSKSGAEIVQKPLRKSMCGKPPFYEERRFL